VSLAQAVVAVQEPQTDQGVLAVAVLVQELMAQQIPVVVEVQSETARQEQVVQVLSFSLLIRWLLFHSLAVSLKRAP